MWGWKAVERLIEPAVSFEEAKRILIEDGGFRLHLSNPSHAIFKRRGTKNPWLEHVPDGAEVSIELALAAGHTGLVLQMRYDTFILFDTGDLDRYADRVVQRLTAHADPAGHADR